MNAQSIGTTEPIWAHWMARPGAQKWVGNGWGPTVSLEPCLVLGKSKTSARGGVGGWARGTGGSLPSRGPVPAPGGGASLTRRPLAPLMPGGPRDPGGPCGEKSLEKPFVRE